MFVFTPLTVYCLWAVMKLLVAQVTLTAAKEDIRILLMLHTLASAQKEREICSHFFKTLDNFLYPL